MKKLLLALSLAAGFAFTAAAADPASHTYEGTITGVVCGSCAEHVTTALKQKLPGVVSVKVKANDDLKTQKLTIVSTSTDVTKASATAALGTYAKNYEIVSLEMKD